jgi:hypothetical protein
MKFAKYYSKSIQNFTGSFKTAAKIPAHTEKAGAGLLPFDVSGFIG